MLRSGMNLKVYELSRRGKERMVRRFDHEGLRQLQKTMQQCNINHIHDILYHADTLNEHRMC